VNASTESSFSKRDSEVTLLGDVSDRTVRRLVKTGRIEAVKVGARLMPRLASVRSFARGK
jgi:hypothetical protein